MLVDFSICFTEMEISHSQKIGIADPAFRAREDDSVIAIPNIKEQILFSWHGISVCSTLSKGTQRQILSNVSGWVKGGEVCVCACVSYFIDDCHSWGKWCG